MKTLQRHLEAGRNGNSAGGRRARTRVDRVKRTNRVTAALPAGSLSRGENQPIWPVLCILFGVPMALMAAKLSGLPGTESLAEHASLASMSEALRDKIVHILFVPFGALLVVLVRLTLGLRILGPFRSILLAIAFQVTGILFGLAFLTLTGERSQYRWPLLWHCWPNRQGSCTCWSAIQNC
jgi:hypothetical protein